ncbi:DUF4873 domain-containing protein [Streptomyces sp. B1I3]|uniref:DUF4873 domain-containing protein n=1 Tax=Streptomyces sp. B1I3 TaxID=3042264 RepID=UPI00277FB55C|nr:DUF4873 domain-containing protein [Streptomyces sp. B1I3]MDQ0791792.1 hypothetical protein [Streptomyces sp. B1I3]
MTAIYEGPATLVIAGEETEVMAALQAVDRGAAGGWSGTVHADGLQASFWAAVQSSGVVIRMPDGSQGSAQVDMDAESGSAMVRGDGPAPF